MPTPSLILAFESAADFRKWLAKNHASPDGLWLRIFKKDSGEVTVTYAEALDEALCYGWIDGQKKSLDSKSWIQRFTPRRARSIWSKINTGHAERLIREKRMRAPGMKQIEAAKADGRWQAAYASPKDHEVPADFVKALRQHPGALTFFKSLNRASTYAMAHRLATAVKPETRERRFKQFLEMMIAGKKIH